MAKVLTAKGIEAARPDPAKRLEIPDGGLPGLYFVIQTSGGKSWAVRYRSPDTGKPSKLTLGKFPFLGLVEAREAARDAMRAVAEGIDPGAVKKAEKAAAPERIERDLVRTIANEFLKRHAAKNRTAAETKRQLDKEILPAWGEKRIQEVTRRDVIDLLDKIADRGSPIMANRVLATVRKFGNWAVSRDIIRVSFAAGVKPVEAERSRERILTDDELRWFWQGTEKLGQPFGPLFRLLLLTAQRRDEVGEIRAREIDGDKWVIPAERAKNGRAHSVHLSEAALGTLESVKRIASKPGYIFTTIGDNPASGYSKAKERLDGLMLKIARDEIEAAGGDPERLEIPHWTLHDLRRTAASGMARIGINLPVIEKVLNHVSGSFGGVAGVYNRHSFSEEMERALDAWSRFVLDLTGDKPAENVVSLRETVQ